MTVCVEKCIILQGLIYSIIRMMWCRLLQTFTNMQTGSCIRDFSLFFKCFKSVMLFWIHAVVLLNTKHGKQKSLTLSFTIECEWMSVSAVDKWKDGWMEGLTSTCDSLSHFV